MPPDELRSRLGAIACRVLEDTAFVFAEPSASTVRHDWMEVALPLHGLEGGSLALGASRGFAVQLAANMLGVEPDDPESESSASEALSELLNIFAGVVAHEILGASPMVRIGIPAPLLEAPSTTGDEIEVMLATDEGEAIGVRLAGISAVRTAG
ncbi:MAG TPA: chemotaxis protein CheX [Vulgatibacter sp.]|nr:chemotaxis protein CheX [Vulgatibacter sp.]